MIPAVELVMSLRYALGDMQGLTISDYQLLEPINQAASRLYGALSQRYVHAVCKHISMIVPTGGTYTLPSDFVRVHQVTGDDGVLVPTSRLPVAEGSYRILGNTLYAVKGTYGLEYYYIPSRLKTLSDNLDVTENMRTYIEQIALALYGRDLQTADYLIQQCENVLAGRTVSYVPNTGPAQVLGGKV